MTLAFVYRKVNETMPSAFLAVLFIFSIHFTENSASDVRMTRYHITSREYKSNINDVPGSYGTRSITDCARHCDANDEECFYYDQELQKCYCNNGTDDEYFTASGSWNGTEVAYGLKTSKKKVK